MSRARWAGTVVGLLALVLFAVPGTRGPAPEPASEHGGQPPERPAARAAPLGVAAPHASEGAASGSSRSPDSEGAAIAGIVYGTDGRPAAGAAVVLAGSGVWPPRQTETGEEGRFRFRGLPPGLYDLHARHEARVAPARRGIHLASRSRVFIGLRLEPGTTLRGTVVEAATDSPIPNARITVTEHGLGLTPRTAHTGPDGRFRIEGLRRRRYRVTVRAEGYVSRSGNKVRAGQPVRLRLRRGVTIEGKVVDTEDTPVRGARVRVLHATETGGRATSGTAGPSLRARLTGPTGTSGSGTSTLGVTSGPVPPVPRSASDLGTESARQGAISRPRARGHVTDARGRFHLDGIAPGSVQLLARHPDHVPTTSQPRYASAGALLDGVKLVLAPGGRIRGRVLDSRGVPRGRVPVELRMPGQARPRFAVTGSDGRFDFDGVGGSAILTARPAGRPAARSRIQIDSGERAHVDLVLDRAQARLAGRVVDPDDVPVSEAEVTIRSLQVDTPMRRTVETKPDGTFSLRGLPAPPYRVTANHPGYASSPTRRIADASRRVRLELAPAAALRGNVLDEWTREPLSGVRVTLRRPGSGQVVARTESGDSGKFEFSLVRSGDYRINLEHDDFLTKGVGVSHAPGARGLEPRDLGTIELVPGGQVSGRVVDALGDPVADAEVAAGRPPTWDAAVRTDAAGRFELRGLPPGEVQLAARHPAAGTRHRRGPVAVYRNDNRSGIRIRLPQRYDPDRVAPGPPVRTGVAATVGPIEGPGVRIASVVEGSRAARTGLREGDRLLRIDGRPVDRPPAARRFLSGPTGVDAILQIRREGRTQDLVIPRERYTVD